MPKKKAFTSAFIMLKFLHTTFTRDGFILHTLHYSVIYSEKLLIWGADCIYCLHFHKKSTVISNPYLEGRITVRYYLSQINVTYSPSSSYSLFKKLLKSSLDMLLQIIEGSAV